MATFKVGQRVRVIANNSGYDGGNRIVGHEGTIVAIDRKRELGRFIVKVSGIVDWQAGDELAPDEWRCEAAELAPLTDPKADAFVESMKRMKPYEEPKVEERIAVHSGFPDK